jgi:hypothetical protein
MLRPVTGIFQHPPQVDDLLGVDVLVSGRFEGLRLCSEGDEEPTVVMLLDRGDSL